MNFLYNAWYIAAWASEVGTGALARPILAKQLVLFRARCGFLRRDGRAGIRAVARLPIAGNMSN
jgi:hypothetical protein